MNYYYGDRVVIDRGMPSMRAGVVVGKSLVKELHAAKATTLYVIQLDAGFYDEGHVTYTSLTLAHPDSLTRLSC